MIKAERKKWAEVLFYFYINRLMRKNFSHFYLANEFPQVPPDYGLIITPNHISWWDGFFIGHVLRLYSPRKVFIMMLEEQLKRFWFFKKVGAFSINPGSAKSILESADYISKLAASEKNCIIIYPQGEIESFEKRPLSIKKGLPLLIRNISSPYYVLPVAFKIQYYEEKYPAIAARFGELIPGELVKENFSEFESRFYDNLNTLNEACFEKRFSTDLFLNKS